MSATILHPRPAAPMAPEPATVLEVRDLATHFPTRAGLVKAVDGVSFTLRRGQTLCVVGESGSGKSVTARSILQIVDSPGRIVSGSMVLHRPDGSTVDLAKLHPRSRQIRAVRGREIAMIFQEPMSSLSPIHTVGDQIIAWARQRRAPAASSCCAKWRSRARNGRSIAIPLNFPAACDSA
jgi:peptide/nickel transport system ATP-binding protein